MQVMPRFSPVKTAKTSRLTTLSRAIGVLDLQRGSWRTCCVTASIAGASVRKSMCALCSRRGETATVEERIGRVGGARGVNRVRYQEIVINLFNLRN